MIPFLGSALLDGAGRAIVLVLSLMPFPKKGLRYASQPSTGLHIVNQACTQNFDTDKAETSKIRLSMHKC